MRRLGMLAPDEAAKAIALTGGVSADVFEVRGASGRRLVVKRSIPRLRVKVDWRAPVTRDEIEVGWLETVRAIDLGLAPAVLARDARQHLFVMEWRDGPVWKTEMAAGRIDPAFAGKVGRQLARIHAATRGRADLAARFPSSDNFFALRIDPFLLYTADRHSDVADRLRSLAQGLLASRSVLVWGDASPKNILAGAEGPVFLDAETAAIGDPAFDLAFCLTHLLLKSIWLSAHSAGLLASFEALRDAYLAPFNPDPDLSCRASSLIGALLLARVDGKSPAGYLNAEQDDIIRSRAKALLTEPGLDLLEMPAFWRGLP